MRVGEEDAGYYSFDAAGVHFVALDSNQYRSPRQLAWLERDLGEAERRGAHALFVYAHEPPYSTALHGDNQICIHDYVPILERHHVRAYLRNSPANGSATGARNVSAKPGGSGVPIASR